MKLRMTALMLTAVLAAPGAARSEDSVEQSTRVWDARELERIEVDNPRGVTTLRASRDGRVHLVAIKVVHHAERRGARELVRSTRLEADEIENGLSLRVLYPQRREIKIGVMDLVKGLEIPEVEVRLMLDVPPTIRVALRSSSGDIETASLSGVQELRTSSGDVDVSGASGALTIDTRSGDATLEEVGSASIGTSSGNVTIGTARGPVEVSTQSGDVRVDDASDSVAVSTASGEVRVGFARTALDVHTGSGDIVARSSGAVRVRTGSGETKVALVAPLEHASLASVSGDLTVRVAAGIDCSLDADAGSGVVDVQLPLEIRKSHGNRVVGRLGRGRTAIVIRSASGSVNVAR